MEYLVMECGLSYAVVLDQDGRIFPSVQITVTPEEPAATEPTTTEPAPPETTDPTPTEPEYNTD